MNVMRRETVEIVRPECEANLRPRYLLEGASWIWHPARGGREQAVLKFRNRFRLDKPTQALIQVSGTRQRGPDGGAGRLVFHFLVGGKPVPLRHGPNDRLLIRPARRGESWRLRQPGDIAVAWVPE